LFLLYISLIWDILYIINFPKGQDEYFVLSVQQLEHAIPETPNECELTIPVADQTRPLLIIEERTASQRRGSDQEHERGLWAEIFIAIR